MFIRTFVRLSLFSLLLLFTRVHHSYSNAHYDDSSSKVANIDDDSVVITSPSPIKLSTTSTTRTTTQKLVTTKRRTTNKSKNRRRKIHPQNLSSKNALIEFVPDLGELKPEQTCLIGDVCMRNGKLGYCYKPHEPAQYERDSRDTEDFYEMMQENCAHFFDKNDNLKHPLCCSPEQEETISRLNANIDLIRKSCPSCLYNVKRLFCNIFCAPNQRDFLRVERVKGETVMEVTMAISSEFVSTFFSSCRDVRVFGAYLLDYDYGCGKHRHANCTAVEFIKVLGNLSEIPFNFKPLIVDSLPIIEIVENKTPNVIVSTWPMALMNDTAYNCYEAPPNQASCHCDHCPKSCSASQRPSHLVRSSSNNQQVSESYSQSKLSKTLSRRSSSADTIFLYSPVCCLIITMMTFLISCLF